MKQFIALLCIAILSSAAEASVTKGENLLVNGGFGLAVRIGYAAALLGKFFKVVYWWIIRYSHA